MIALKPAVGYQREPSARNSSELNRIDTEARFSSRCAIEEVPGIGSMAGERCSSQASPIWASPLVRAVLAGEDSSRQGMIAGRETDRVWVAITPGEGLDGARISQFCSQDGAVANPLTNLARERVEEGRYLGARLLLAEGGIPARGDKR